MFGYFDDPFYYGYAPRYYVYRPRVSVFDRYMASVAERLAELLDDESFHAQHGLDFERKKEALESAMKHDAADHSETKAKAEAEAKSLYGSDEATSAPAKQNKTQAPAPASRCGYFFQSRSSFNGRDYVEEHRERVTDDDGTVHTTTRRRLGDRWYEQETHTDKDGKSTSKETWHNVPEESIESFKSEWSAKHGLKYEGSSSGAEAGAVSSIEGASDAPQGA